MPVYPSGKIIFIHIPKTGGLSLRLFFEKQFGKRSDDKKYIHNCADQYVPHCCTQEQWDTYQKIAVVRNPFARIVSGYKYVKESGLWRGDFASFISKILQHAGPLRMGKTRAFDKYGISCCRYLEGFDGEIVRFDELKERFNGVGWKHKSSDRRPFQEFYTPEIRAKIEESFGDDLRRFGYSFEE